MAGNDSVATQRTIDVPSMMWDPRKGQIQSMRKISVGNSTEIDGSPHQDCEQEGVIE